MSQTASSYNIYLSNDGAGNYTPTALRNPGTVASSGTAISIPWTMNNNSGVSTGAGTVTTLLPGVAIQAGLRAIVNYAAGPTTAGVVNTTGSQVTTGSYNLYLSNDGAGNFTPTVLLNPGTVASGGTTVTIPFVENNNASPAATTTKLIGVGLQAALRAIVDDIANGN